MFCPKCGSKVSEDSVFCNKCGSMIDKENIKEKITENNDKPNITEIAKKFDKQKIKFILIAIIIISIVGITIKCIVGVATENEKTVKNEDTSIASSTYSTNNSDLNESQQAPVDIYEEATDIKIIATKVQDGHGYLSLKNIGTKTIKDMIISCVEYDASGNVITSTNNKTYSNTNFTSANILPDSVYGLEHYISVKNNTKYIDVAVTSITYQDNTKWQTSGIDGWAEKVSSEFSVEAYKSSVENMQNSAISAENNPYIQILKATKSHTNQFSNKDDIDITIRNVGSQAVKKVDMLFLEYDSNGYAISVSPYTFVTQNSRKSLIGSANLNPENNEDFKDDLFFEPNCEFFKQTVYSIEFMDGTVWTNENALPWMLYNENRR